MTISYMPNYNETATRLSWGESWRERKARVKAKASPELKRAVSASIRGFSVNRKFLTVAYLIEAAIIGGLFYTQYNFAERYASEDSMAWTMMIVGGLIMAVIELCRVPLATAAAKTKRWSLWPALIPAVIGCVFISGKGIAQIFEQQFSPRLIEVVQAKAALAERQARLLNFQEMAEVPAVEVATLDKQISEATALVSSLTEAQKAIGSQPKSQPIYRTNRKGQRYLAGHTTPAWAGTKTQAQIDTATADLQKLQTQKKVLFAEKSDTAVGVAKQIEEVKKAEAGVAHAVQHSQLHAFTGMLYAKDPTTVTEDELFNLMRWFILIAAFASAIVPTMLAYASITRIETQKSPKQPKPAHVQPVLKIVPDIKVAMKAL